MTKTPTHRVNVVDVGAMRLVDLRAFEGRMFAHAPLFDQIAQNLRPANGIGATCYVLPPSFSALMAKRRTWEQVEVWDLLRGAAPSPRVCAYVDGAKLQPMETAKLSGVEVLADGPRGLEAL